MNPEVNPREFAELAENLHAASTPTRTAEEVVEFALQQLGADRGGITLIRRAGRLRTIAATDVLVERIDALQYELGEGSCRDSSWRGQTLVSEDLAADQRWPRWGPKAADLGVTSVLATELTGIEGRRIGSVSLYWDKPKAFDADDIAFAQIFTRHAAVALTSSLEHEGLNVALDARKLIGQAQGILMERHDLSEDRAFEVLKRYSQDHNMKLRRIAEYIVSTRTLPSGGGGYKHE